MLKWTEQGTQNSNLRRVMKGEEDPPKHKILIDCSIFNNFTCIQQDLRLKTTRRMQQSEELVDVADTSFLDGKEFDNSSSDSDSEIDQHYVFSPVQTRLFGRKQPLHIVLGSGKVANIILWRDKQMSGCALAAVTFIWFIVEVMEYNLLAFICDSLLLLLATLFLWNTLGSYANIYPPDFTEFVISDRVLVNAARSMRFGFNHGFRTFQIVARGQDWKKFVLFIVTLWAISLIGRWFTVTSLLYLVFVLLLIVPALYERHEDTVDIVVGDAFTEFNRHFATLCQKVLEKLPKVDSVTDYEQY